MLGLSKILTNFFIFKIGGLIAKKNMLKGAREKKKTDQKKRQKEKKIINKKEKEKQKKINRELAIKKICFNFA